MPGSRGPRRPVLLAVVGVLAVGLVVTTVWTSCSGPDSAPRSGPSSGAGPKASPTVPLAAPGEDPATTARRVASRLSDLDLVGQMLMPFVYGDAPNAVSAATRSANLGRTGAATPAGIIQKYRLGGVILVRQSADDPTAQSSQGSNIETPAQLRRLVDGFQQAARKLPARVPLMVGTDQEGGTVTRIRDGVTRLPSAMAFGAAGDPVLTERAAAVSGAELAALGLDVDFAPVADVIGGPGNTVIGSRSFGAEPTQVSRQVAAAVKGYLSSGVAPAVKHFPGHGHTDVDSHKALPELTQSRAGLERDDLAPFRAAIAAGAPIVMSGHLDTRAIDPGVPASLSRKVLTGLLRDELGFGGMIVTDGLDMKALTDKYGPAEVAVRAILAGNDLLLLPPDLHAAQQGLLAALKSGRIPHGRAVDAVTRVLTVKLRRTSAAPPMSTLGNAADQAVLDQVAAKAVTVLKGACRGALLRGPVTVTGGSSDARRSLTTALHANGVQLGGGGDSVHLAGYGDTAADLHPATVTVATDVPYILASAKSKTLLATYSNLDSSMRALAKVLAGKATAPGRSPVPVSGLPRSAC
jgi:beta-N-acetylhexosaminidase